MLCLRKGILQNRHLKYDDSTPPCLSFEMLTLRFSEAPRAFIVSGSETITRKQDHCTNLFLQSHRPRRNHLFGITKAFNKLQYHIVRFLMMKKFTIITPPEYGVILLDAIGKQNVAHLT
jgi:hypothetical protein